MRYVFFAVVSIINLIFMGAVFPNLNLVGIYPDIIIASIVSIAILEQSMAGAMIGLVCGLMLDLLFSSAIGIYAIPYLIVGASMFFCQKKFAICGSVFAADTFCRRGKPDERVYFRIDCIHDGRRL